MLLTDYKFWYITRDNNGFIIEAAVRFYEGSITTEDEIDIESNKLVPVTRYRRSKRLRKSDLSRQKNKFRKEKNGNDVRIYHKSEYGSIKLDSELCSFLDQELKKDSTRKAIKGQRA